MKYFTVQGKPHLCLFAVRDISPGEEITYNYGDSDWPWRCKVVKILRCETDGPPTSEPYTSTQKVSAGASSGLLTSFDKDLDEVIPLQDSGGHKSPSTTEDIEEMTAESNRIQTAASDLNQSSPVLGPPNRVGKDLDEVIPLQDSGATNPPSTTEDIEEQPDSDGCGDLNQSSPVLGPPNRVGKDLDEVIPLQDSGATNPPSTTEDIEEMTAESNRIQTAASDLNQSSPVLGPPNRVGKMTTENNQNRFPSPSQMDPVVNSGKCKKHRLVCATVSSLDKCVQCVGPVSSFKWLGYECRVCSGVWHKSCLRRITNFQDPSQEEQFSKCSRDELLSDKDDVPDSELDQISDDDENMSDKDYIPDSESQNDDADDDDTDASIPFMPSQSKAKQVQVNPVLPDVGTSYGSDTSIPVVPSTSKC
ncbi:uncharacterized protein LOC122867972 [Siniperca chuatsi]|uniref:uncharacterized protein LOC122867972 n=1 Tax=Siniperca chuatsi TaxID=119488 RepID=UPI001CE0D688|nr:uncharacterized protein LOC122867972 [Siniperca chuatsi]